MKWNYNSKINIIMYIGMYGGHFHIELHQKYKYSLKQVIFMFYKGSMSRYIILDSQWNKKCTTNNFFIFVNAFFQKVFHLFNDYRFSISKCHRDIILGEGQNVNFSLLFYKYLSLPLTRRKKTENCWHSKNRKTW